MIAVRAFVAAAVALLGGCFSEPSSSSSEGDCDVGRIGCPCSGEVCFEGLVCVEGTCEATETGTGTSSSSSSTGPSTSGDASGVSSTGAAPTSVLLYITSGRTTGDFETASGLAQGLCEMGMPADCQTTIPIVTTEGDPSLAGLAASIPQLPVRGRDDFIADSMSEMVGDSVSLSMSLVEAGLPNLEYWTGFTGEGDQLGPSNTCELWMTSDTSADGRTGRAMSSDNGWYSVGEAPCDAQLPLLCACW